MDSKKRQNGEDINAKDVKPIFNSTKETITKNDSGVSTSKSTITANIDDLLEAGVSEEEILKAVKESATAYKEKKSKADKVSQKRMLTAKAIYDWLVESKMLKQSASSEKNVKAINAIGQFLKLVEDSYKINADYFNIDTSIDSIVDSLSALCFSIAQEQQKEKMCKIPILSSPYTLWKHFFNF